MFNAAQVQAAVAAALAAIETKTEPPPDGVFTWWVLRRPLYLNTARLLPRPATSKQGSGMQVDPLKMHRARAVFALTEVLAKDPAAETRLSAAKALGQVASARDTDAVGALTKGLSDDKRRVRWGCALALGLTGFPPALATVRRIARNPNANAELRGMALLGLGLGGGAGEEDLALLASLSAMTRAGAVRQGAILGLGALASDRARRVLRRIVVNGNYKKADRMLAAAGLNSKGSLEDLAALLQVARAEGPHCRWSGFRPLPVVRSASIARADPSARAAWRVR